MSIEGVTRTIKNTLKQLGREWVRGQLGHCTILDVMSRAKSASLNIANDQGMGEEEADYIFVGALEALNDAGNYQ